MQEWTRSLNKNNMIKDAARLNPTKTKVLTSPSVY